MKNDDVTLVLLRENLDSLVNTDCNTSIVINTPEGKRRDPLTQGGQKSSSNGKSGLKFTSFLFIVAICLSFLLGRVSNFTQVEQGDSRSTDLKDKTELKKGKKIFFSTTGKNHVITLSKPIKDVELQNTEDKKRYRVSVNLFAKEGDNVLFRNNKVKIQVGGDIYIKPDNQKKYIVGKLEETREFSLVQKKSQGWYEFQLEGFIEK